MTTSTKGHWPAGKRRNPVTGWSRTHQAWVKLIQSRPENGIVSGRACAASLGVSPRTVYRWMTGEDVPSQEMQQQIREWTNARKGRP